MVSRLEAAKDTAQEVAESAATHAGRIATIVTGAVREVTREFGDWATDLFEAGDAARRSQTEHR